MGSADSEINLQNLLDQLNLEEKVSLLAGQNFWETFSIPRLSIPSVKFTDGPNGARGSTFEGGVKAACFPASVCLAATWDRHLAAQVGAALAEETKTKGAVGLLGPTVCPHRSPLGGRNFESFSEDPYLAGKLASRYIQGLQQMGVAAVVKHFAANEQETRRRMMNVIVSEKALREIYLKPFEIAVKEANPWALMTSYNLVNGEHADMNGFLLKKVLREQWGFKGLVVSDWGGTNSTVESINAGVDLEMPGPTTRRKFKDIQAAIDSGKIAVEDIENAALRVLQLVKQTGKFEHPEAVPEQAINNPLHQKLIRDVGAQGIVLLKNKDNILPLKSKKLKSVALLGLAKRCLASGGGSAKLGGHYEVTPFQAIEQILARDGVDVRYAEGAQTFRNFPDMKENLFDLSGKPGLTLSRYENRDLTGQPYAVTNIASASVRPNFQDSKSRDLQASVKVEGTYRPSVGGSHYLSFSSLGPSKVFIDDQFIFETIGCADPVAFLVGANKDDTFQFNFVRGHDHKIRVESVARLTDPQRLTNAAFFDGLLVYHLGFMTQGLFEKDLVPQAVEAASSADLALVFVGNTPEWETEGQDMSSMSLPARGSQDRLISAVAEVNSNVIVINSTGVPIDMPWLPSISAMLQVWFGGQESGNSIADVLFGSVNPSGKLPVTIPKTLKDTPCYENFPGDVDKLEVKYEEGINVGYRYYDKYPERVLYPFGFGLSYSSFTIDQLTLQSLALKYGGSIRVQTNVKNTGDVAGSEVVQVYIAPLNSSVDRPLKTLAGFAKVTLQPGQSETVEIDVDFDSAAYWDEDVSLWRITKGDYEVLVGNSALNIVERKKFVVDEEITYGP